MFVNSSVFKKMMKKAYKNGGLIIGNFGDTIMVCGGYWVLQMAADHITKKDKAAIIELIGELPGAGEILRAEDGMPDQYELELKEVYQVMNMPMDNEEVTVTRITYDTGYAEVRILQKRNLECVLADEAVVQMISLKNLEETETKPKGPMISANGNGVYWINEYAGLYTSIVECRNEKRDIYTLIAAMRTMVMEDCRKEIMSE